MVQSKRDESTSPGAILRAERVKKKLSIAAVADALRARETVIVALENDDFSVFAADMYARGFIRNYARIVGLDAAPLVAAYQDQYGKHDPDILTPNRREAPPLVMPNQGVRSAKPAVIGVVLAVVALIAVTSVVLGGRAPDTASVDDVIDVSPEPASPNEDAPPTNDAPEAPEPVEITGVELVLIFEQASWMQILVDGVLVREETIRAGETLQYRGDEIRVRFGNAGGVFAELNGEDLGIQGGRGEVIDVRYTRDGAEVS